MMEITLIPTALAGVVIVETAFVHDERGFFMESYNQRTYAAHGLTETWVQDNHSRSRQGVLRGIHYQGAPAPMAKLVRCLVGTILDVAVDLRLGSPTFGHWVAVELSADNKRQLLIPVGFGHAFLTLSEAAEVFYKCSAYYLPSAEGAIAWDDPELAIDWPSRTPTLSRRDQQAISLAEYRQRPAFTNEGERR